MADGLRADSLSGGEHTATSGSAGRRARPLMEPLMIFSLEGEIESLREEQPWAEGDRNSRPLASEPDFRVLLATLRAGASLDEVDGGSRASMQLVDGRAELRAHGRRIELRAGEVAVVDAGQPWLLTAVVDCAVLLTLAWPGTHRADRPERARTRGLTTPA
jgi:quercetin dioxygenase-like cupin family protein